MYEEANFFSLVYSVVKLIPSGRVTTYGAIPSYIGSPQASRMVGWALNSSHNIVDVPAHRVVNRNGMLSGKHHFGGPFVMQELLANEGVEVKDDKIINFKKIFWNPQTELQYE